MSEIGESDTEDRNELLRENQVLSENLSKCMEEKNFVWSLWKKLQTEKPDLSSVVSLVMAREKEKNEIRDAKVLKILETKDLQIQQLEREKVILNDDDKQKEDEMKAYGLRLHDLLIEKTELQENMDSIRVEYELKIKSITEENDYLSELVHARQMKLENDENIYKVKLDDMDKEKQELHKVVKDLEYRVDKLNDEKILNSAVIEENINLKHHLEVLQEQLISLRQEHEDGMATLRLRERQLQQQSSVNEENNEILNEKEKLLHSFRQELKELKLIHDQCGDHAKEQTVLIQKLQSLQDQTQTVIKVQEERFKSEVSGLKEQLKDSVRLRETLEADIEHSKLQECETCIALKEELQSAKDRNDELLETTQKKNRRISSLEKTLVSKDSGKTKISPSKAVETKFKMAEKKIFELQKVLEFKQNELDAVNFAHSNRLQRYKNLQHEHKIVLEQLKTFENLSEDEVKIRVEEQPTPRASPRSLQKEDSDSVWNELQHFKTEYEKLRNERDGVMEEIDALRVDHANDVTTVQELRMCLEDEKRELVEQMKVNNAGENEEIKQENKRLRNEKNDLLLQLERVKNECSVTQEERESLKKNLSEQEQLVEHLAGEISKYKKELKIMKNEKKKRKEIVDKTTQVDDALFVKRKTNVHSDKQVQTDETFEKQLHEATKQLILDAARDNLSQQHKTNQLDTRTSPIKTTAEPSSFAESTTLGERTTRLDDSSATQDEDGDIPVDHHQSSQTAFETPAKRSRMKAKSSARREWGSMRQRVLSLTQQVTALKAAKESLTKSFNEQKFSNEKLQNDLNLSQQRAKISKQTLERLGKQLEESQRQNQALIKSSKEYKIPSYPTEKHLEDRLKLSSNECSRLSHELKTARKTNEELSEKCKLLQEKNSHHEHTLNQKKVFVEEMRSRLKVTLSNLESTQENLQESEEKVRQLTEKENQRKNQMDSLKHRLKTATQEKQNLEQLYAQNEEELKRKAKRLTQAQKLRQEAEIAVNEMEEAAKTQLHNLANQSQITLSSIEERLTRSRRRLDEFHIVVKVLYVL